MDRFAQLAVVATEEALSEAGWLDQEPLAPSRAGVIFGTGVGGMLTMERQILRYHEQAGPVSPLGVPMMMANAATAQVALRYGFRGATFAMLSACASGAHSICVGAMMVRSGDADMMVVGGAESALTEMTCASFLEMGALSPTGTCRPFDRRRDGFILSEGAGALILEDAELAQSRGAPILGEVLGTAMTTDAYHLTAPAPAGRGAREAIVGALEHAGLSPADVDCVNAHGTSTLLNDRAETEALRGAFGPEVSAKVPISAPKSAIGHTLGAAGAVEAIALLASLRHAFAPPTLGYEEPDEDLNLDYVPHGRPLRRDGDAPERLIGISNSFAFGGHNAVVCLAAEPLS